MLHTPRSHGGGRRDKTPHTLLTFTHFLTPLLPRLDDLRASSPPTTKIWEVLRGVLQLGPTCPSLETRPSAPDQPRRLLRGRPSPMSRGGLFGSNWFTLLLDHRHTNPLPPSLQPTLSRAFPRISTPSVSLRCPPLPRLVGASCCLVSVDWVIEMHAQGRGVVVAWEREVTAWWTAPPIIPVVFGDARLPACPAYVDAHFPPVQSIACAVRKRRR